MGRSPDGRVLLGGGGEYALSRQDTGTILIEGGITKCLQKTARHSLILLFLLCLFSELLKKTHLGEPDNT